MQTSFPSSLLAMSPAVFRIPVYFIAVGRERFRAEQVRRDSISISSFPHPCHQRSSRSRFEEADDPSEHDNHPIRDCQTEVVHGRRQIQLENKGGVWPLPGSFCPPPRRSKMRGYAENFIFVAPDFRARCSWVVGRERDSDNESGVCCCSRGTTGLAREQWREQQQEPPCWQRPWPSSDCSRGRGHCLRRFRSRSRSTGWRRERMP